MRGRYDFSRIIRLVERSSDPVAPAEGRAVVWLSDGTGSGDDGDIMAKGQANTTTKYSAIFDHSAGS